MPRSSHRRHCSATDPNRLWRHRAVPTLDSENNGPASGQLVSLLLLIFQYAHKIAIKVSRFGGSSRWWKPWQLHVTMPHFTVSLQLCRSDHQTRFLLPKGKESCQRLAGHSCLAAAHRPYTAHVVSGFSTVYIQSILSSSFSPSAFNTAAQLSTVPEQVPVGVRVLHFHSSASIRKCDRSVSVSSEVCERNVHLEAMHALSDRNRFTFFRLFVCFRNSALLCSLSVAQLRSVFYWVGCNSVQTSVFLKLFLRKMLGTRKISD